MSGSRKKKSVAAAANSSPGIREALAVRLAQAARLPSVDPQRGVDEAVVELVQQPGRDEEEAVLVGVAAEQQLDLGAGPGAHGIERVER